MRTSFVSALIAIWLAVPAFAESLDSEVETIEVTNPTLYGIPFSAGSSSQAYVCQLKGFSSAELLEWQEIVNGGTAYVAYILGAANPIQKVGALFSLEKQNQSRVIKRLRCSNKR